MIESKKFKNKYTGEIATQIPMMSMNDWEEVRDEKVKVNKKLPEKVQLYGDMFMRNNGDIIYISNKGRGYETEPFRFNLQESSPRQFQKIVDTYGTKEGKKVREQTFYGIAKALGK